MQFLDFARNSGDITLNGAAARRVAVGDVLILIAYAFHGFGGG